MVSRRPREERPLDERRATRLRSSRGVHTVRSIRRRPARRTASSCRPTSTSIVITLDRGVAVGRSDASQPVTDRSTQTPCARTKPPVELVSRAVPDIRQARIPQELPAVAELFRAYAASLDVDLSFQDFDRELAG